jgi:uncharacterized protein
MSESVQAVTRSSPALARIVPFAAYLAFLAAAPVLRPLLPDGRWLYLVQIGVVAALLLCFARHYVELTARTIAPSAWLLALATGSAVFVLWINLDLPWVAFEQDISFNPTNRAGALDWPLVVVRLCGAALIVPVMEELFWRSFLMRWIDDADFLAWSPLAVTGRALLVSSVLFGAEHQLWLAGILAGLAYAWLYRKTGVLWLPIAAHACTNLLLGLWVVATGHWQFW